MAQQSDEARELRLVDAVEMRIALAETDQKLEALLDKYLAPLLLKLASESLAVRQKVIAICQHINTRIRPLGSFKLPVAALLQQFKDVNATLVRNFDLIYIKHSLDRMNASEQVELLPQLASGISTIENPNQAANLFHLILKLLPLLKLPSRGTPEDAGLRQKLGLSDEDAAFLAKWFLKLLLLTPVKSQEPKPCPGLSPAEYAFVNKHSTFAEVWNPSTPGGINLVETKSAVSRLLQTGAFKDKERFTAAIVISADPNGRISEVGDDMLRHNELGLENESVVQDLFTLYLGDSAPDGASPARPNVQIKALSFLSKSVAAARRSQEIQRIIQSVLMPDDDDQTPSGLEAEKLRSGIFSFILWVARMGTPSTLQAVAPSAIDAVKQFIMSQGWPVPATPGHRLSGPEQHARSLAYETIGILKSKISHETLTEESVTSDIAILRWLLESLCLDYSSGQIPVSIDQALGSILNSFSSMSNGGSTIAYPAIVFKLQEELASLLTEFMALKEGMQEPRTSLEVVRNARYICLRFANRCLPFSHVQARWLDLVAAGSKALGERYEVVEEAQKGLDPYWYKMFNPPPFGTDDTSTLPQYRYPDFEELVRFMFACDEQSDMLTASLPSRFSLQGASGPGASSSWGTSSGNSNLASLMPAVSFARNVLLCEALANAGTPLTNEPEWNTRLDAKLAHDEASRAALRKYINDEKRSHVVRFFLNAALAGFLGAQDKRYDGYGLDRCGTYFVEIASLASTAVLYPLSKTVLHPDFRSVLLSNDIQLQDVACRVFSMLASTPSLDVEYYANLSSDLSPVVSSWQSATGPILNQVRGALLVCANLIGRVYLRGRSTALPSGIPSFAASAAIELLRQSHDMTLRDAAHKAIGYLSLACPTVVGTVLEQDHAASSGVISELLKDARKEKESAISALGNLYQCFPPSLARCSEIIECLYGLHDIRKPEVQFAVGESLSIVALGWGSKVLITAFDVDSERPPTTSSSGVLSEMVNKLIGGCKASKPSLRKASAIWLLCLVQYCGSASQVQMKLRDAQAAFISLLSDRDDLVQETGSRGLSVVYGMGTQELKVELIRDLVRVFTAGESGKSNVLGGGRVSEETELFDAGSLPTGEGSSVTTYKDIVGLASEVGDPSLVYRFMAMASHNAIWSSRAAFGRFGLGDILSDTSTSGYMSQNPMIYAKLFRYRFDPNPNVQRSMNDLWNALVKDSNATIDANFDLIMSDLLKSILAGREWRVREASCAAIADLIQGRPLEKYDPYLDEILTKAFKVLDDIKGSVRAAALRLCTVLTNIVIRTLEAGNASDSKRPRTMLGHVVPFMLGDGGMLSATEDVQAYATVTMTRIIKKAPSKVLQPFIPAILERFLGSLSFLEPQSVHFIHLNADKYGLTGQEIDKMRLSAIRTSPMMESIELHLIDAIDASDEAAVLKIADTLEDVIRHAVGLPSKVGVSRVIAMLCSKPLVFRPHADKFIILMRKYVMDRNDTVSAAYSSCIGYLARSASEGQIFKTIDFAKVLYLETDPNEDSIRRRVVAGEIIEAMSKRAADQMSRVSSAYLPFTFVAKHDRDDGVREHFENVWQENVTGSLSVLIMYFSDILDLIAANLDSTQWAIKQASALSVKEVVDLLVSETRSVPMSKEQAYQAWPIVQKAVSGKTWEGKEEVLFSFVKFCCGANDLWMSDTKIRKDMLTIILREAKRNNVKYRPHGLKALGDFALGRRDITILGEALAIVQPIVEGCISDDSSPDNDMDKREQAKLQEQTLSAAIKCLLCCVNLSLDNQGMYQVKNVISMVPVVDQAVQQGGRDTIFALYDGLMLCFEDVKKHGMSATDETSSFQDSISLLATHLLYKDRENAGLVLESVRLRRAEAAAACLELLKSRHSRLDFRDKIASWLSGERSTQVQAALRTSLHQ